MMMMTMMMLMMMTWIQQPMQWHSPFQAPTLSVAAHINAMHSNRLRRNVQNHFSAFLEFICKCNKVLEIIVKCSWVELSLGTIWCFLFSSFCELQPDWAFRKSSPEWSRGQHPLASDCGACDDDDDDDYYNDYNDDDDDWVAACENIWPVPNWVPGGFQAKRREWVCPLILSTIIVIIIIIIITTITIPLSCQLQ